MVAKKIANIGHGGDRSTKSPIGDLVGGKSEAVSQEQDASMLNVGKRSVERAARVVDDGVPELVAAVERGDTSVSGADRTRPTREVIVEG